jgi:hypothetical protein
MLTRPLPLLLVCALCLAATAQVRADMYKWVDDRGVVNYGDRLPPRAKDPRPLELEVDGTASIRGIPKEELLLLRERDAERRLQQLEAEVEELRSREATPAAAPAAEQSEARASWYPVYGFPASGYGRKRVRHPEAGQPSRPMHPIARPLPERRSTRQTAPAPRSAHQKQLPPQQEPYFPSKR